MKRTTIFPILATCVLAACTHDRTQTRLVDYVDPYIGSDFHGHVFVGASVPFGMVQLGPNNIFKGWDWCSGYHYSDSIVAGFSHTHLNGTGVGDLGDILLMPYTGDVRIRRGEQNDLGGGYATTYSHDNETVRPDYYSLLMDNGVRAELTATARAGMHRYTYPAGETPRLMIDLLEGNRCKADSTGMRLVDDRTIEGYRYTKGWAPRRRVYFRLETDRPILSLELFDNDRKVEGTQADGKIKGVVTFAPDSKPVTLKVGISPVGCEGAAANLAAEIPHWDFDRIVREGHNAWERELAKIRVETPDTVKKKIFYTAMYHAAVAPMLCCDADGSYRGMDDRVRRDPDFVNYSTFSLWDTYRALNPLFTVIHSDKVGDFVRSMLSVYDQHGRLPIWGLWGTDTYCMPGYSAVQVICDAYLKGIGGFDPEKAFEAVRATATHPDQRGIPYVMESGYIPADKEFESVSYGMEYAVADWGISRMARKLGKNADYETFSERGDHFARYIDTALRLARPKLSDGTWKTPYDPFRSIHGKGDFCEGNGWQYTFFAPQHPELLIRMMGGDEAFCRQLDSLFIAEGEMGEEASMDISGLIGQYAHGNEPSHHTVYLYAFAGQQWKAAEKARRIMDEFYLATPSGIIGNEDCGQMSAWYILSAMGFYQVNPCSGLFVFGSPQMDRAEIALPEGKKFTVRAENNLPENKYIRSVTLNGRDYAKSYITYADIMQGGELVFVMGPEPNFEFGAAPENRPRSEVFDQL